MKPLVISLLLQFDCPATITPELIQGLIIRESNGYSDKVSSAGAIGLMQIRPIVLIDYNKNSDSDYLIDDLYNPEINLTVGIWHLCRYQFKTKSSRDLLQIYFAGFDRWKELKENPEHDMWEKLEWYVGSIYHRKWIIKSLARIDL